MIKETTYPLLAILFLCLFLSGARAQDVSIIKEIQIQGNSYVKDEEIKKVIVSKVGEPLSEERVREDMQAIYDMGFFSDLKAFKEDVEGGVRLIFEVKENKKISEIIFEGVEESEVPKLKRLINLKRDRLWNFKEAREDKEKILEYYHKKGFFSASVNVSCLPSGKETCKAVFNVQRGERRRVKEICIKGNYALSEERIRSLLRTRPKCYFNEKTLEKDLERVIHLYRRLGYHFAYFKEPRFEFFSERRLLKKEKVNLVRIFLEIVEGKKVFVSEIKIEGNEALTTPEILSLIRPRKGQVFVLDYLKESIDKLKDRYGEKGYVYVQIGWNLEFNETKDKVKVMLSIKEGPQVRVGKVRIEGAESCQERVFKHTLLVKEGDVFNVAKIRESWRRLYNLGFFEKVEIRPLSTSSPKVLDLLVKVSEEKRKGRLFLGAGYSSVSKLEGFIQAYKDNLWGEGKQIGVDWNFGKIRNEYDISYLDRWFNDSSTSLKVRLYDKWGRYEYYDNEEYNYEKETRGGSLALGWPIGEQIEAFVTFKDEDVEIKNIEGDTGELSEGKSTCRSLELFLRRDARVRDEAFNPYKGTYSSLSIEKSGGFLGGDAEFIKYKGELRGYLRQGEFWKSPILAYRLRGQLGENLFEYEKFYIGGQDTLRGYSQNEFYGDRAVLGSLELRFPMSKQLTGVLFVDSGRVWGGSEMSDFKTGFGFGMRIRTLLGIIRLDYGVGEEGRFYFGMGEGF